MVPEDLPYRRPWCWPLGWLFTLGIVLGAGFWVRCAWLWLHWTEYSRNVHYYWLDQALWLAVATLGLLGTILTINNLIRQNWKRALWWLLLTGLAAGHCAAGFLPLIVSMGAGTTPDVPKED